MNDFVDFSTFLYDDLNINQNSFFIFLFALLLNSVNKESSTKTMKNS